MNEPQTIVDKLWDAHEIVRRDDGESLLWVDRHYIHEGSFHAFGKLAERGAKVAEPELTFGVADHYVPTHSSRRHIANPEIGRMVRQVEENTAKHGVKLFGLEDSRQGIVHVVGPEQGLTLPGLLIVCGDSHTCTHGGMGALAFGIGSSEVAHVLATQALIQRRPKRLRVSFEGARAPGVAPKDMILYLIGRIGAAGGTGYAVEYAGSAVRALEVEGRLTLCNLSIELGAKMGMVAPDDTTFTYLAGREFAPAGALWDAAVAAWRQLPSDGDARFDREEHIDMAAIAPQITWGTSPEQVIGVTERIPDPAGMTDPGKRRAAEAALDYMGLAPGAPIAGTAIQYVFIGSCTNSRISDLRAAAEVAQRGKVAPQVRAWVVPGSENVKRQAEAEGLDRIFRAAGFDWREPGCSMCLAANGETVPRGERSVSTSNRNFVGRQGPGARTHLASPAMAAAAALAGAIADVRTLGG